MNRKILTLFAVLAATALPLAAEVTLDDIVATHVESRGGMEALDNIKTMRISARMMMGPGMEAPFSMEMKRPNSMRLEFEFQGMKGVQAFDGETGWQIMPFMGSSEPEKVTGAELEQMKEQADFDGPLVNYEERGDKLEYLGTEDVDGTEAHKVKLTKENGDETIYFLDAEYCLELKSESTTTRQGMEINVTTTYGDYKEVGGVMMAHSLSMTTSMGTQALTFENVEVNMDIADERFAFPEADVEEPAADAGE